jgi:hypothetical protein
MSINIADAKIQAPPVNPPGLGCCGEGLANHEAATNPRHDKAGRGCDKGQDNATFSALLAGQPVHWFHR